MTYPFEVTLTSATPELEINAANNSIVADMIAQEAASSGSCVDCATQEIPQLPTGGAWLMGISLSSNFPVSIDIGYFIPPGNTFVSIYKTYGLQGGVPVNDPFMDGIPLDIDGQASGRRLAIKRSDSAEVTIQVSGVLEFFKR